MKAKKYLFATTKKKFRITNGLRDPTAVAAKKQQPIRKALGRGTLNTCAKFRVYLSKTAWTFGRLCGKVAS